MPSECDTTDGRVSCGTFAASVVANVQICREHFRLSLRIEGPFPDSVPGQFVQLLCRPPATSWEAVKLLGRQRQWQMPPGGGGLPSCQAELQRPLALLRRPFSIADRVEIGGRIESTSGSSRVVAVAGTGTVIDVVHRVVGTGTYWLASLVTGDTVDLLGPLGNAFRLPPTPVSALLVGGGVGLPPMFYAARLLKQLGHDAVAFVGATTRDLLAVGLDGLAEADTAGVATPCTRPFLDHGYSTVVTTDDGSCGLRGTIVDGLVGHLQRLTCEHKRRCLVLTCGPTKMMRAVAKASEEAAVPCQVCLEQAMACGMATCQSCVVPIAATGEPHGQTAAGRSWRYRLACTDGPVFDAEEVAWEEMV